MRLTSLFAVTLGLLLNVSVSGIPRWGETAGPSAGDHERPLHVECLR